MPENQPPGPCLELKNPKVFKYINAKIRQYDRSQKMEDLAALVKSNMNIVLTGAPGTGKTYLAKEIARQIVGKGNETDNITFVQFHPSYDYTDFVEGLRPVDKGESQIGFRLEDGILKTICKKAIEHKDKEFVLIIDEINRGEIAKIFGELFYSFDPGYRGEEGRIITQYNNLIPEKDIFKKGLYIPENVYLIATMNDIDRSVESIDFAIRRRFTWIEIKASDTAEEMFQKEIPQYKDEALQRLYALNDKISDGSMELLNESYHIGGAYFIKLKKYHGDYEKLWNYHLRPLLHEYLRGNEDLENNMNKLKDAFDLASVKDNGDSDDDQNKG
jgi:5-methylcytosine-specific restriction endonuclease McrBC GTP-binding regulatory subunit McrB